MCISAAVADQQPGRGTKQPFNPRYWVRLTESLSDLFDLKHFKRVRLVQSLRFFCFIYSGYLVSWRSPPTKANLPERGDFIVFSASQ
jgi:hypothetical protein